MNKFNVGDKVQFKKDVTQPWGLRNVKLCELEGIDINGVYVVCDISYSGKFLRLDKIGGGYNVGRFEKIEEEPKMELVKCEFSVGDKVMFKQIYEPTNGARSNTEICKREKLDSSKVYTVKAIHFHTPMGTPFPEGVIVLEEYRNGYFNSNRFEKYVSVPKKEEVKQMPSKDVVSNPMVGVKPTDIIAEDDVWGHKNPKGARVKVISLYQDSAGTLIVGYRYLKSVTLPKGYVAQMSVDDFQRSFPTLLGRRIPKEPKSQPKPQMKRKMKVRRAFGIDKFVFDVRYEFCQETDTVYAKTAVHGYEDFEGVARLKKGDVFSSVKGRDIAGWKLIREIANAKLDELCK